MNAFWRKWLVVWCGAVAVFGAVLTLGASAATDALVRALFAPLGGSEPEMTPALRFAVALLGAVTLGWAYTLYAAIGSAIDLGDQAVGAWRRIVGGVLGWFVIDSSLSLATGFDLNAVSNGIFVAAFLPPVLASGVLHVRTAQSMR